MDLNLSILAEAMSKGLEKGNGGQKAKQPIKTVKRPQMIDAKKTNNVKDIPDSLVLSYTLEEEHDDDSLSNRWMSMPQTLIGQILMMRGVKWRVR